MSGNVVAIELGFGTDSICAGLDENGLPKVVTFDSIVAQVEGTRSDMSSGLMKRDTVTVDVDGLSYEIGRDAHLATSKGASRILNNQYIDSQQYKALLKGSMVLAGLDTIDLLVLGVPVTSLHRAAELKAMAIGKHTIAGKQIEVRAVWVIVQPLGGLLSYSNAIGQDSYNRLKEHNTLSIDCGYGTLDFLCSRGLKVNENRSSAVEAGMGVLINDLWDRCLRQAFPKANRIPIDIIDHAFWKTPGVLTISGRRYPFPVCEGKDCDGEPVNVRYDARPVIDSFTKAALTEVRNCAGTGEDIQLILLFGGPAGVYLPAVQSAYPDHKIHVLQNSLTAVCEGMYFGGVQYLKQSAKSSK